MRETLRWLQGAGVAALVALYEVLSTAQASGTGIAVRAVLVAVLVRVLGYVVSKLPVSAAGVLVAIGLVLTQACSPANAGTPAPPRELALRVVAAGDTARLFGSWPAVRGATGYLVTVTAGATNGAWTGLPGSLAQAGRTLAVVATSSAADSAAFVLCVRAANPVDTSAAGCSAARTWRRRLVPPTPSIDSVVALLVHPPTLTLLVGSTGQLCGFPLFPSGAVALRARDGASCDSTYRATFGPSTIALVTPALQARADALCYDWASSDPAVASLAPESCPFGSRRLRVVLPARAAA